MKSEILKDITCYIDFLRQSGYLVTLSCFDACLEEHLPILLNYEVHLSPLCSYLKSNLKTRGRCPKNKRYLEKKNILAPYYSCCYAGVEEFVIPLYDAQQMICCVHVSGFRGNIPQSARRAVKKEKILGQEFTELYNQLSPQIPDMQSVLTFVKPLEYMMKALKKECIEKANTTDLSSRIYQSVLRYIYDNYMNDINLSEIAGNLNYSASYIRHVFARKSKKTISQIITSVRLSQAQYLLRSTSLPITRIGIECGFCDGNYFSVVFKSNFGISPKEYRRRHQG